MSTPHRARLVPALVALVSVVMIGCGSGQAGQAAGEFASGPITVIGVYVAALASDAPAGMYFTIENSGPAPDTLLGITTDVAERAELHREATHGNSMIMEPVADVPVPAGGELRFAPGGYHVMLTGLHHTLAPGDTVVATLELRHAGRVPIRAVVVSYAELEQRISESAPARH